MKKNIILSIMICLLLASCVVKEPIIKTYPITLSIKSPEFKLIGNGFYRAGKNYTNLQLYSAGQLILNYESNSFSCINSDCVPKSTFNKKIFYNTHYGKIMDDILAGRAIYDSKNIEKYNFGFKQKIFKKDNYDIEYIVEQEMIVFADSMHNVTIQIRR